MHDMKQIQAKRVRQGNREIKRELKAQAYRRAALSGGGDREVERRFLQTLYRQLRVSM